MLLNTLLNATPPDLWHDPVFLFGVVISITLFAVILGSIIILRISLRQNNLKEISYQVISDTPIVSLTKEVTDSLQLQVNEEPVRDMNLLVLNVWNSGDTDVILEGHDEEIEFRFGGETVLGGDIVKTEPKHLLEKIRAQNSFIIEQKTIKLAKLLLKIKNSITIKVLLTGSEGQVITRGRIANGKIIESNLRGEMDYSKTRIRRILVAGIIGVFIIWFFVGFAYIIVFNNSQVLLTGAAILSGPLGVIIAYYFKESESV